MEIEEVHELVPADIALSLGLQLRLLAFRCCFVRSTWHGFIETDLLTPRLSGGSS
jgi:hypothetical protein